QLLDALPTFIASNRLNIVARLGERGHPRFGEALDVILRDEVPGQILGSRVVELGDDRGPMVASYGDVAAGLFSQIGEAVLRHAPDRMVRLVPVLPANVTL